MNVSNNFIESELDKLYSLISSLKIDNIQLTQEQKSLI